MDAGAGGDGDAKDQEDDDWEEDVNDGDRGLQAIGDGGEGMPALGNGDAARIRELRAAACPWLEGCE
jgi:hypothetical protein